MSLIVMISQYYILLTTNSEETAIINIFLAGLLYLYAYGLSRKNYMFYLGKQKFFWNL
jgi:hypothetical protein